MYSQVERGTLLEPVNVVAVLRGSEISLITAKKGFASLWEVHRVTAVRFCSKYVKIAFQMGRIFFVHDVSGFLGKEVHVVVVCLSEDVTAGSKLYGVLLGFLEAKFISTHVLVVVLSEHRQRGVEIDEF